jgi:hypothetical protein
MPGLYNVITSDSICGNSAEAIAYDTGVRPSRFRIRGQGNMKNIATRNRDF